ncbi:isochorismatase domain-containing protein 2 isoform X1 [Xenopus laevis]|uniref:Isochorismatase domain-containing protein 2 n=2 Tax=Xenopus laevis TaxID=8355 RepID=ISOC2_XENLA|nr:isochorismatase domain-containing protein 2 precursor [Xenopus laevis]XP_018082506.1 isochorismatase domain-containing protein 2 isoform X1 [Xenopus laevis]Q5PQ71.1 RecName: Full=Isochorismatase domain-containing protein 2 [Xenopus laevis]AAH87336.1 LOC495962 protein [Xenopus laevis]
MSSLRRIGKLGERSSVLFLCDMQEKFRKSIVFFPEIVSVAARMLQAAKKLEMPVIITEQHPKGLGPTVPELGADDLKKYTKTSFSMLTPEVEEELQSIPDLRSIVLCGIETQACIMSTALDLLDKGYDVHVVADACSSRSQVDRLFALSRMRQSGAFLTTSEGVLLQLLGDAKHPKFKEVQKIIMEPAPDSGLLSLFRGPNLFST